ncbi:hypothetical protein BDN70DRAFT_343021 [Pholiota conissans]|uniref:Uncharacterized protein n=1 Tax=Pholiota conissans TaxID=109636 RepID=A0A9P6CWS1_9AGAR|nr:hypothetical protein BDN70DRAFT_343021 [Pholiota conissans]
MALLPLPFLFPLQRRLPAWTKLPSTPPRLSFSFIVVCIIVLPFPCAFCGFYTLSDFASLEPILPCISSHACLRAVLAVLRPHARHHTPLFSFEHSPSFSSYALSHHPPVFHSFLRNIQFTHRASAIASRQPHTIGSTAPPTHVFINLYIMVSFCLLSNVDRPVVFCICTHLSFLIDLRISGVNLIHRDHNDQFVDFN